MVNTLFLRLEGVLQSWGERGRWSVRDTAPEPTKSGLVGLLACALGLNSDDALRELSRKIRLGIRCDRPGTLLVDYHTIVGGVMSAEGKVKKNANTGEPETVVSWRHYLCDASFLAAVQATAQVIEHLAQAVQAPHWPIYLGRKSCPPSCPVFAGTGEYQSLVAALQAIPLELSGASERVIQLRGVVECASDEENAVRRRDEVNSLSHRTFGPRYVKEIPLLVPAQPENGGG